MVHREPECAEDVLDRALDKLLTSGEWRDEIPADHPERAELLELMATAQRLAEAVGALETINRRRWLRTLRETVDRAH